MDSLEEVAQQARMASLSSDEGAGIPEGAWPHYAVNLWSGAVAGVGFGIK